jgi:hypothetical protein
LEGLIASIADPDSGFTYDPTHGAPTEGMVLSIYPSRSRAMDANKIGLDDLADYLDGNSDLIDGDDHYMGGWHDPETGKAVLDVSVVTRTREEAVRLCRQHDQKAFYDVIKGEVVVVDPEAASGGALDRGD